MSYRPRGTRRFACAFGKGVTFDWAETAQADRGHADMIGHGRRRGGARRVRGRRALGVEYEVLDRRSDREQVSGRAYRIGDCSPPRRQAVEITTPTRRADSRSATAIVYAAKLADGILDLDAHRRLLIALVPRIAGVCPGRRARGDGCCRERSVEAMWRLPLPDDLKQLKSKVPT